MAFELLSFHSMKAAYHFKHKCTAIAGMLVVILMFSSFSNIDKPVEVVTIDFTESEAVYKTIVFGIDESDVDLISDNELEYISDDEQVDFDDQVVVDDMDVVYLREDGSIGYHWHHIDKVFDFLLSIGMKPFVELNPMPKLLSSGEQTMFWYKIYM